MMGPGRMNVGGMPMSNLAQALSPLVGRIVLDKTELTGNYDFELNYSPEGLAARGPADPERRPIPVDPNMPTIFTALQEQLGLKLDSQRGPVDVVVIDRLEQPVADWHWRPFVSCNSKIRNANTERSWRQRCRAAAGRSHKFSSSRSSPRAFRPPQRRDPQYAGQVVFAGVAVPGATVTATQGDTHLTTSSDVQGIFRIIDIADGAWTMRVEMRGFADTHARGHDRPRDPARDVGAHAAAVRGDHTRSAATAASPGAGSGIEQSDTRHALASERAEAGATPQTGFQRAGVARRHRRLPHDRRPRHQRMIRRQMRPRPQMDS